MPRGRKPHSDPPVAMYLSVPSSLAAKVDLLLFDATTGKPKYGGRSGLVQLLLRGWVDGQITIAQHSPTPEADRKS